MHHPTRHAVEAMLPAGTTIDDLTEQEISALFDSIVQQAEAEADGGTEPEAEPAPAADPERAA